MIVCDAQHRRQLIEQEFRNARFHHGNRFLHFENLFNVHRMLDLGLRLTGLRARGERNALEIQVTEQEFMFTDLPPAFDRFRILQLSDLHINGHGRIVDRIIEIISGIEVDLCCMTGDYRFHLGQQCAPTFHRDLSRVYRAINSRLGTVAILGNHDLLEDAMTLRTLGATVLVNESCAIRNDGEEVWLAGVDDPHYYCCDDLPQAMMEIPEHAFKILLAHTPSIYEEAADEEFDLYLCGHTHAGQIRLPLVGPVIRHVNCPFEYQRRLWRHRGMWGYTCEGAGSSGVPVRFNCRPEIAVHTLRKMQDT